MGHVSRSGPVTLRDLAEDLCKNMFGSLPTRGQLQVAMSWLASATPALAAASESWVPVTERLPDNEHPCLVWIASPAASVYGGWWEVAFYGAWDFFDTDDNWKELQDEDGQVRGRGWHREQEEQGGDTITYPLEPRFTQETVTHWMPLPRKL